MKHLRKSEFVDALDGTLSPASTDHLAVCDACRAHIGGLRDTLARTNDVAVPEPSPLFWEHFASNVREAIREPAPRSTAFGWFRRPAGVWTMAAAVATVVIAVAVTYRSPLSTGHGTNFSAEAPATSPGTARNQLTPADNIDSDEGWALVRSVADEIPWDQTHAAGLSTPPGSVERITSEMSPEERRELARLVEDELRRNGA